MKKEIKTNMNYYDKNAESWAARNKDVFSREKEFIKFTKYFKPGAKIIDIGCAAGFHIPLFLGLARKLEYEGFDISKKLISIAKRRYPQLKFYVANLVEKKSLPQKKYDGFWASAVLMHVPEGDWPLMLKNISGICKPKAVGFLILPKDRPNPSSSKDNRFFTYWDKKKLTKILKPAGWKIIGSSKIFSFNQGKWSWYLVRLP